MRMFVTKGLVPNAAMSPKQLQDELIEGLTPPTRDIDIAHDFFATSGVFFADRNEYPESPEELTEDQLREYVEWLKETGIEMEMRDDPFSVPPAYFFQYVAPVPEGSWLLHHTDANFTSFQQGTTMEGLQLSTYKKKKAKAGPRNLDDESSLYERIFAFAFSIEDDPLIDRYGRPRNVPRPKYGKRMLLFQCDAAVTAWHPGDEEQQVIFPVGTEYNVHQIWVDDDLWQIELDGDVQSFETIQELIAAVSE